MSEQESQYPEHRKMHKVVKTSQEIGEFLDWLFNTKHYQIAEYGFVPTNAPSGTKPKEWHYVGERRNTDRLYPVLHSSHGLIVELLAEYYGIDLLKIEQEKRQMLEEIRDATRKAFIK